MAARLTALSLNAVKQQILQSSKVKAVKPKMQTRAMSSILTETGAVCPRPEITSLGLLKITVVIIPFTILGGYMSREFASLMEEYDIFLPDDDDD